jgi:hypothetical protein
MPSNQKEAEAVLDWAQQVPIRQTQPWQPQFCTMANALEASDTSCSKQQWHCSLLCRPIETPVMTTHDEPKHPYSSGGGRPVRWMISYQLAASQFSLAVEEHI